MAADAAAVRAGRAFVELFADPSKLDAGLAKAAGKLQAWGGSISAIGSRLAGGTGAALGPLYAAASLLGGGGAIVAGFLTAAKGAADTGRELLFLSQRTGVSVEELSKLKFAAERSGVPLEDLDHLLGKMHKTVLEAAKGSADATLALARLGTSAADLGALAPVDQLRRLADGLQRVEDVTLRDALAMGVFGRGGREVLTFLGEGSGKIDTLMKRAEELGIVMSTEDVKAAKAFGSAMADITAVAKYLSFTIGATVAPVFADLVKQATPYVKTAVAWVRENQGLIVSALKVGGALLAAGLGMKLLGAATATTAGLLRFMIPGLSPFSVLTLGIKAARVALAALPAAFNFVKGAVAALPALLGAVFSPAGLLVAGTAAAVVGLGYLFAKSTQGTASLEHMKEAWAGIKDAAVTAWGGIQDALATGDLKGAAEIAWLGVKVAGLEALTGLKAAWAEFSSFMKGLWATITAGMKMAFGDVTDSIAKSIIGLGKYRAVINVVSPALGAALSAAGVGNTEEERAAQVAVIDEAARLREKEAGEDLAAALDKIEEERRAAVARAKGLSAGQGAAVAAGGLAGLVEPLADPLADARRELARAIAEAKAKREAAAKKAEEGAVPPGGGPPGLGGLSAVGTFNPFGAAALGAGGVFDRIEDKLGDLLEVNRRIQQAIEDGSLFA